MRLGALVSSHATVALYVVAACRHAPSTASPAEERASFVRLYRGDTVVVERFRRTRDSLVGELYVRPPSNRVDSARVAYHASLAADGRVRRIELTAWRIGAPLDATPVRRWVTELRSDSIIDVEYSGASTTPFLRHAYAARGPVLPFYARSMAMLEGMTVWARRVGGDVRRIDFQVMPVASRTGPHSAYIEWVGRDSAIIGQGDAEPRGPVAPFAVDAEGRIVGVRRVGDFVEWRTP